MKGFLRAAYYARVSSQKQADEMTIQSQCAALVERIAEDGLRIAPDFEFCDEGCSGSELLRPALESLRDAIAAGRIDCLYVHSPDRLARKYVHQALLLEEFKRYDCEVVFLNQRGLPETPEAELLIQMQGVIAEYEREKILERTRRGRRHAAAAGRVSVFSGAPYGYRYVPRQEAGGAARWDIDPHESEVVRLIFELFARRRLSLRAVCRELDARGIRTRTGAAKWNRGTVRGILLNSAYCGLARFGKKRLAPRKPGKRPKQGDPPTPRRAKVAVATRPEEQITIPVPALVDAALFAQVARQMDENRKRQRERQPGAKFLLSGLVVCGECGAAYCARTQNGGKHRYYRCLGGDRHRVARTVLCTNTSVRGTQLEERVWSDVCALLRDPQRMQAELERRRELSHSSSSELAERERRVQRLRKRLDALIDALAAGHITQDEFASRIGPLRDQHEREASALESLRGAADPADAQHAADTLQRFARELESRLDTASLALKREVLKLLIDRIEIHREQITIVYKVPCHPFPQGPDNRGQLHHCWSRASAATAARPS